MANVFGGNEIAEMGIQIEKNGKDFYDTLTAKSKNQKARDIFKYLAGEEEKHIAIFRKILNSVQKYEPPEAYPGEYFAYMNALAGDYVFTQKDKGKKIAEDTKTDLEAIDIAIGAEKDSILFYSGMRKLIPDYDSEIIDQLIDQEQNHLRQLSDLKKSL